MELFKRRTRQKSDRDRVPNDEEFRPPAETLTTGSLGMRTQHFSYRARKAAAPILELIDQPNIRDIFIHEDKDAERAAVWIDTGAGLTQVHETHITPQQLRLLAAELISAGGRQLDELHPCVDVTLGDGVRVHAVLAPVAVGGTVLSIRLPNVNVLNFSQLVEGGLCQPQDAQVLRQCIASRQNLLITGGTGSGKTTLLSALIELVPRNERIITIEDVAELRPRHPHRITLEARAANSEGTGEITLDRLLRESLRMRPDRIVLGECRGSEIATMLSALNTGHDGGAGTLHASTIYDTAHRLEALGALAGMTVEALARQAVSAFDLVIHLTREHGVFSIAAFGTLSLNVAGALQVSRVQPRRDSLVAAA